VCDASLKLSNNLCVECGETNQPACNPADFYECNQGCNQHLNVVGGVCRPCGDANQAPCPIHNRLKKMCTKYIDWDDCKPGLGVLHGVCQTCGAEDKVPCDNGCIGGVKTKNGLCTASCGNQNQQACDGGTCYAPLQVLQDVCKTCGSEQTPPCPQGGCRAPLKIRQGLCALCGSEGRPPCNTGCDAGGLPAHGVCSTTCGKEGFLPCDNGCRSGFIMGPQGTCELPAACAGQGQACVTGSFGTAGTGLVCCVAGGPFICEWGLCQRCITHGSEVPLGGTQRCCDRDDFVVADGQGGQKCDIPDLPNH
jgi:hypothetical protein